MTAELAVNEARVKIRRGPLVGAVLSRVVGMLAARAQCPIDRLDDALLATDAIAAHAADFSVDGHACVVVSADEDGLTLLISPLRPGGAEELLRSASLPGVGNVLERVAEVEALAGPDDTTELRVRIEFHPA